MKQCIQCNKLTEDQYAFCTSCGSREFRPVDVQNNAPAAPQAPAPAPQMPTEPNKPKGNKSLKAVIIACVVVILLVATGAALFILKPWDKSEGGTSKNKKDKDTEPKETYSLTYEKEKIVLDDNGKYWYEKLTFSGKYDGVDKINENLDYEFSVIENGIYRVGFSDVGYYNTKVKSVWNDEKYVSICLIAEYDLYGMGDEVDLYTITYDLKTGEELDITECLSDVSEDQIRNALYEKVGAYFEASDYNDFTEDAKDYINDNFDDIYYYLTKDTVHVLFGFYEIGIGRGECIDVEIAVKDIKNYKGEPADDTKGVSKLTPKNLTDSQMEDILNAFDGAGFDIAEDDKNYVSKADAIAEKIEKKTGYTLVYILTDDNVGCYYIVEETYIDEGYIEVVMVDSDKEAAYVGEFCSEAFLLFSHGYLIDEAEDKAIEIVKNEYPEYEDTDLVVSAGEDYILVQTPDESAGFRVDYDFSGAVETDERIVEY